MKILSIFKESIELVKKNKKLVILFWCTNAAMSVVLAMPIYSMLVDNLKHSELSQTLPASIDFLWFTQFMEIYSGTLNKLPLLTYGIVGIYAIVQTFYFGGMVSVFFNKSKNHITDFFYGGVKLWFSFMKVLLISLVFFGISFKFYDLVGDGLTWLLRDSEYYLADFILRSLLYLLLLFLIGIVTIISDYTKVSIAIDNQKHVTKGIAQSLLFLKSNFHLAFPVFLIVSIIGGLGALIYNIIDAYIPRAPLYFLLITFILQQLLIIFRLLIRMLFCATEVVIYSDNVAEIIHPPVKESNVGVK
jgi:hypothetical protein